MKFILGTSMWGWTIKKATAFEILDFYYAQGGRQVDTATNYPINKNTLDWRKAENILAEWINANGVNDLEIWVKVGSLDNLRSPQHNLHPSFLYLALDYYQNLFKSNLHTFGIHWDNRDNVNEIAASFTALNDIHRAGYQLGFSGVQRPNLYADLNQNYHFKFRIQLKNNILQSDYDRYPQFHDQHEFIAYGINANGLKLKPNRYREQSYLKMRGGDPSQPHPIISKVQTIIEQA
ncbi:MAG: aldo/keto reductase, partial [Saprospiraceae bacterium]